MFKTQIIKRIIIMLELYMFKSIGLNVARWMLPQIIDWLLTMAKKHVNDPTTDADDVWYNQTAVFLKDIGDKKLR